MRIYNATNGSMNLPMPSGSRLIIGPKELSRQFYPTVELLSLLVSAYSRDDIAIIIDTAAEVSMGATISALPGYVVGSPEEAILRFKKDNKDSVSNVTEPVKKEVKSKGSATSGKDVTSESNTDLNNKSK